MVLRVGLFGLLLSSLIACGGHSFGSDYDYGYGDPDSDDGRSPHSPPSAIDDGRTSAAPTTPKPSRPAPPSEPSEPSEPSDDAGSEPPDASVDAPPSPPPPPNPPPPPPLVPDAKRVFETSHYFSGDLKTEGWADTGLAGADNLCNSAALIANLGSPGTWRAWLSAPGEDARDRIADVSPWYFVDRRTKVFDAKIGLGRGAMLAQVPGIDVGPLVDHIAMNEFGAINSPVNDWTGTSKLGIASAFTCQGWTSNQYGNEALMGIGSSVQIDWWTDSVTNPCYLKARLLCFEQ